ncbi:MAG: hypothetical protein EPO52_03505 [Herbiconiux sp.]|uniref:helix-turn-helix transcriptional regulator n=1 Tax=Herbiconiux sp. TaxID=1871186 RepID=UPI00121D6386|nr:LuxR C-terminal-related transcriptional regulator [Herbiconiux sp.]TAJ49354.1 MAG: hypothetical protein EPO52_03505 [Herbiconiux sp.]
MAAKTVPQLPDGHRLHGRDQQFKHLLRLIDRDHAAARPGAFVLVTGRPGVGRSGFLDAAASALAGRREVIVVRGRTHLSAIPLGALAPHLATLPPSGGENADVVEFHRSMNRPEVLLLVDDADLLDSASQCILEQVAAAGVASIVVSRSTRSTRSPSILGQRATATIELDPLSSGEAHALLKDRLGQSIGALAADEMVRLAAGSTKLLVELAMAADGASDLNDHTADWRTRWPYVSEGVRTALPADPGTADPLVEDLLMVLAVAGDLPVEQGGTSGVSERGTALAESAGFVITRREDGRVWVSLSHPLYAPVVLSSMSEQWLAGFCAAGADMLDGYPEHRVRRALLQLGAGQTVRADLLLELARHELGAKRYTTAMTLGVHVVDGCDDDPVLRSTGEFVQAQALSQAGRVEEATQHFDAAWDALEGVISGVDDAYVVALAQAEGNHLAFRTLRPELAVSRLEKIVEKVGDQALRAQVESDLAKWRLMAGNGAEASLGSLPDALAPVGHVDTPADLNLLIMTATLQTMGGNLTLAAEAVDRGLAECDRYRDVLPNARDLLQLSQVLVLSFSGQFPTARTAARANLAAAEESNPSARGLWKFVLAMIELHTGSPARAWKQIAEGRRDLVWRDIAGLLPAADALSAAIAARTGRFAIARSWLDQVDTTEVRDPKVKLYAALARAWVSSASGRPGFAIRSLAPVVHAASENGHRYLAALVAYEAVRIEPLVGATVMLPTLIAARTAFPICESHARAIVGRHDVLPIAKQLAEAGLLGPAIDAARWVAEHSANDLVQAARAHRLADSWTVRAGVAMTPRQRQAHPRVTPLTDREWQLASGAAAHRTSAELAAEYGISVRTVDNHLARIYKKLGITGRRELPAELSELQLDSAYEDFATGRG